MATQAISKNLDPNTHGTGYLHARGNLKVFINNSLVNTAGSIATPDLRCSDKRPRHCHPHAISGSLKIFIKNIPVHRAGDLRLCGARTVSLFNLKVFAG